MNELPAPARAVLESADFCHVTAETALGPHVTPTVFAVAGGRVWVTTSRRSVKARSLRRDPRVAGLVRAGADAVVFTGEAVAHDALDPASWPTTALRAPLVSMAAVRFTRKNARFFAGYAMDAGHVPLAWTPPGRVFLELVVRRLALLRDGRPAQTWGPWPNADPAGGQRFRAARTGEPPLARLPSEVADALGDAGPAALAVSGADGPVVVPAAWVAHGAGLYAVPTEAALVLAGPSGGGLRVALEMDRPSSWRARHMLGAMVRGRGQVSLVRDLSSGSRSALAVAAAAGVDGGDLAIVRVHPERFVWWRGWTSGTVVVP
ncbi:MAG TPA: pyridoxamine 5'-phosphate oxidase family protein [Actinomycetota bacterium]|nr:pyridoxamine 5'-phosphate oxidase family protein [Actinomycetota bacterium]